MFKKKKKKKEVRREKGKERERLLLGLYFLKTLVATVRVNGSKLFEDIKDNTSNCETEALDELDFTIPLIRQS